MKVRKFFAPTSREALRLVREALGADAVVLSNRVVDGGVELVALTEENLTDWVADGGTTHMLDGALPSWDQAFGNDAAAASEQLAPSVRSTRPSLPLAAPAAASKAAAAPFSASSQFPWRDAPPRSQANRTAAAASAPAARSISSGSAPVSNAANASDTRRRDRTVALPGVLAAADLADDGVSALAYKHRGLRSDEAPQSTSSSASASAYAQNDVREDADDEAEDEADVVYKPSGLVGLVAKPAAPAGRAVTQQRAPAAHVSPEAASTFVPFTAASVRTADAPLSASELSVPATGASATSVPNADHAAALMKTNDPKRSATRSIFARIFSRQSPAERANVAASESAAEAMSRLANRDEDASVLGLQRAERRDESADASLSSAASPRRDTTLSASSATARGMGTASAPIIVRPTATREEALLARQPASATLPQEARAMYESEMFPQQDVVQQDFAQAPVQSYTSAYASADASPYASDYAQSNEQFDAPSYPEGFSPQDFEAAIVAARMADANAAVVSETAYVDNNMADTAAYAVADALPDVVAQVVLQPQPINHALADSAQAATATALNAEASADVGVNLNAEVSVTNTSVNVSASKSAGMSFAPAHYTAQTRLKGMSTGQSTGHGVPFLQVSQAPQAPQAPQASPDTQAAAPVPVTVPVLETTLAAAPVAVEPAVYTTNDVPAIDLGEVAEVMAAPQSVEAANLMETADVSREAEPAVMSTPTPAPTSTPAAAAAAAAAAPTPSPSEANHPRVIAGKMLLEMQTLCGTLGEQLNALESQSTVRPDPTRVAMTRMLLGCGFSAQLVRLLLARMPVVADAEQGLAWVKATFERNLPVLDNEDALMEQGGVFALMGPTGVGKTTTTAKLAARAVMRHGADRVALLTTDSYRIGAHEQLRIYGRILGVAVHAVKDAADLSLVLSELRNKHMVLIDTIGMSQRDRAVSEQVSMLCGSHLPVKRLLLLNATSHGDTLNEVVRAYGTRDASNGAASGLSGCIITKVDESHGIGAALDTVMRHRLPVHYVSNGQKVPEDLRVARRGFLIDNAFSERNRASPFQPDEDDLSMIFGGDEQAANMLSSNAMANEMHASEAHYG